MKIILFSLSFFPFLFTVYSFAKNNNGNHIFFCLMFFLVELQNQDSCCPDPAAEVPCLHVAVYEFSS